MFNSKSLQGIIVLVLGLILAAWLGLSIVTNQGETIFEIIGAIALISCIYLGNRIWLLIPFMGAINLTLRIPGQPNTLILGQMLALGFCLLLFFMRKIRIKFQFTELEVWVLILTACVLQVYFRNPVGLNIFGGDTVGGKGYVLYAIALVSMLLLAGLQVPSKDLKLIVSLSIMGGVINFAISVLGIFVPSIGFHIGASYVRSDEVNYENFGKTVDEKAATRIGFLVIASSNLALWVPTFISPLRACIKPLWAILIFGSIAAAAYSGFRISIITVGLTFLMGIAYRNGLSGFLSSIAGVFAGLLLLSVANAISPLPPNVQRSLSFLPGNWNERYVEDADNSTEWRVEVWKEVLLTNRWITNKIFGDGLGFTATELAAQMNASTRKEARLGISGFESHRESVLASGDYHSGPVSTIRVIGYTGTIIFILGQIRLAMRAHQQINRCRKTEWFPLALFVGIPLIFAPFFFVFIFGDFKTTCSTFLLSVGMLRLLENNLPLPAYVKYRMIPYHLRTQTK